MAKLLINIHSCPINTPNSFHALEFAKQAIIENHEILQVFFYGDGVYNASNLRYFAEDEVNITEQWQKLHNQHATELNCCINSSIKRGIIGKKEQQQYNKNTNNLAEHFQITGLATWIKLSRQVDRIIQF